MNDKVVESFRFWMNILETGSNKQQPKAKNKLNKMATAHPDEAQEAGYEGDPVKVVRVWNFYCMAAPHVLEAGFEDAVEEQMRLRHQLFNELVHGSRGLYKKYMKLFAQSPAQAKLLSLKEQRKVLSDKIFAMIKKNHATKEKNKGKGRHITPEVVEFRRRVKEINTELAALRPMVHQEKFEANKGKDKQDLGAKMQSFQKKLRQKFAALGLRQPNYNAVLQDFNVAFKNALKSTEADEIRLGFHYEIRDEPNKLPPDIRDWEAWDHCGKVSIAVTNPGERNKDFATVFDGTNTQFQLRPITEKEWLSFGSRQKLDFSKEKTKRVHLARIRVGSIGSKLQPVFAEVPVMLHREFPKDAELCSASIITRRVAGRLERELHVGIGFPGHEPRTKGAKARVEIGLNLEQNTFATLTRTNGKQFRDWALDPNNPCGQLMSGDQVLIDQEIIRAEDLCHDLYSHISEHFKRASVEITALGMLRMPAWFEKAQCHTKSSRGISRVFRTWRAQVINSQKSEEAKLEVRAFFKQMREISRNGIKDDWEATAEEIAFEIRERFGTAANLARLLAIALMFAERADHLGSWAENLQRKARRRRKNNYRVIASRFLRGVSSVEIPKVRLWTREMSKEQRAAGITEFLDALKNYAQKESIGIVQYVPEAKETEKAA